MVDPGHVFRRAFSWLPSQFASQSDAPVGPRQFGSTEHLSTEAVAAFVDGELRMTAHLRAAHHLSLCPQCATEVEAQRQARAALRDSCPIVVPSSLLGMLSQIPHHAPPEPPGRPSEGATPGSAHPADTGALDAERDGQGGGQPDDPWRDPSAAAALGTPALARVAPAPSNAAMGKLGVRDVLFGGRVSYVALAVLAITALGIGLAGGRGCRPKGRGGQAVTPSRVTLE